MSKKNKTKREKMLWELLKELALDSTTLVSAIVDADEHIDEGGDEYSDVAALRATLRKVNLLLTHGE